MITLLDLLQDDDFRQYVKERLSKCLGNSTYCFPKTFPILYKYRPFSKYAVDDILNKKFTFSSVGEFNDIFDSTIHIYATEDEINEAAAKKWNEFEQIMDSANIPTTLQKSYIIDIYKKYFQEESQLKFDCSSYLGIYVCSFSEKNDSTLMWSHYANDNKGICIEYDFNKIDNRHGFRKMLYPVAYSNKPIDLSDLFTDEKHEIYEYPYDAAVLSAILNKSNIWNYEKEWRIILPLSEKKQRLSIDSIIKPTNICFGYRFLKSFFLYDLKNAVSEDIERIKENIILLNNLFDYAIKSNISISVTLPAIGSYDIKPNSIETTVLQKFIQKTFAKGTPIDIRYYDCIQDELVKLLKRKEKQCPPNPPQ